MASDENRMQAGVLRKQGGLGLCQEKSMRKNSGVASGNFPSG
jgi:hypothetical protein